MDFGPRLWAESSRSGGAFGDPEDLWDAWERLFGEKLALVRAVEIEEAVPDSTAYLMPNGYIAVRRANGLGEIYESV